MSTVTVVIVTYNRIGLLRKCLCAISKQTVVPNHILVIDNCSTDGTQEFMSKEQKEQRVIYTRLKKNIGGAGGFYEGIKKAMELNDDYFWIMDDDTIPTSGALVNLLEAGEKLESNWGFLSSNVRWIDKSSARMNQLTPRKYWSEYINEGLVAVETGTFVSLLIKRSAVREVGLPIADFFIWGDDTEFTTRLSTINSGYFVSDSIVIHETTNNIGVDIFDEQPVSRINRYFYSFRNSFYIAKIQKEGFKYLLKSILKSIKILTSNTDYKFKKILTLYRGLLAGAFFHPTIKFYQDN